MKHLYEIEINLILYVMAEDEDDAIDVAYKNAGNEINNLARHEISATKAKGGIFANWNDAYPYGGNESRTVREIFEAEKTEREKQKEREEWEKKQLKLFNHPTDSHTRSNPNPPAEPTGNLAM